ncbi:MAG: JAB domain-containing protein [Candidatus Faecivicinus sp.]
MTASERRQKRCMSAIRDVLKFLRKKDSPDETLKQLKAHYLSPSSILESGYCSLSRESLSESEALLLSLIPDLTRHCLNMQYGEHPRLNKFSIAGEYLRTLYIGVTVEQFYLLCLDASGKLIECRLLQKGSVDETPFYLAHLLQGVATTEARAIVLSHNHPGGSLRPSQADVRCTIDALRALLPLGVPMLDHIIIADGQAVSLRDTGFISVSLWDDQDPSSALLQNWLDVE